MSARLAAAAVVMLLGVAFAGCNPFGGSGGHPRAHPGAVAGREPDADRHAGAHTDHRARGGGDARADSDVGRQPVSHSDPDGVTNTDARARRSGAALQQLRHHRRGHDAGQLRLPDRG